MFKNLYPASTARKSPLIIVSLYETTNIKNTLFLIRAGRK
jgi:hypothetical protein